MKKIALALLVLFVASTFAFAQRNFMRDYGVNGILALKDELQLSASQISQLEALQKQARKDNQESRKQIQKEREELEALLSAETLDLAAIEKKLRSIADKEVKLKLNRLKTQQETYNILTAAQKNKLKEIIRQREEERKKRREERRKSRGERKPRK